MAAPSETFPLRKRVTTATPSRSAAPTRGLTWVFRVTPMTEVLLFHHALGQTPGFLAFAEDLRSAGHTVHAPDLYDGRTFAELDDGVGYAKQVGFDKISQRGAAAADDLPAGVVYAGLSLGVVPAQMLAQTRPGALGALLLYSC